MKIAVDDQSRPRLDGGDQLSDVVVARLMESSLCWLFSRGVTMEKAGVVPLWRRSSMLVAGTRLRALGAVEAFGEGRADAPMPSAGLEVIAVAGSGGAGSPVDLPRQAWRASSSSRSSGRRGRWGPCSSAQLGPRLPSVVGTHDGILAVLLGTTMGDGARVTAPSAAVSDRLGTGGCERRVVAR